MGLSEELWGAMHGVAAAARCEKHPGMLQDLLKIANHSLEGWRAASTTQFADLACKMIPKVWNRSAYAWAYGSPGANKVFPSMVAAVEQLYKLLEYISSVSMTGEPADCYDSEC